MFGMCDVRDVECSGCGMFRMWDFWTWDVREVVCSGRGMFGTWDVRHVGCSGCRMFRLWDVWDVGCSGCGMFGMWDVRDVGCLGCGMFAGMWNVDLQNAPFFYRTPLDDCFCLICQLDSNADIRSCFVKQLLAKYNENRYSFFIKLESLFSIVY